MHRSRPKQCDGLALWCGQLSVQKHHVRAGPNTCCNVQAGNIVFTDAPVVKDRVRGQGQLPAQSSGFRARRSGSGGAEGQLSSLDSGLSARQAAAVALLSQLMQEAMGGDTSEQPADDRDGLRQAEGHCADPLLQQGDSQPLAATSGQPAMRRTHSQGRSQIDWAGGEQHNPQPLRPARMPARQTPARATQDRNTAIGSAQEFLTMTQAPAPLRTTNRQPSKRRTAGSSSVLLQQQASMTETDAAAQEHLGAEAIQPVSRLAVVMSCLEGPG